MMPDFQQVTKPVLGLNPKYPFELTERAKPVQKRRQRRNRYFLISAERCAGIRFQYKR